MPYRVVHFENNGFYHVYNRGVEKRQIFTTDTDYQRFLATLIYYQFEGPKPRFSTYKRFRIKDFSRNPKIVEIICDCFMPNHLHLLIRQLKNGGITEYMSKVTNSYTKYFNTKYHRVGPLLQGEFKAARITSDQQLQHLSRYIHLNPFVAEMVQQPEDYQYSSYNCFIADVTDPLCNPAPVLELFKNRADYKAFADDHAGYALDLERIKHQLLDME